MSDTPTLRGRWYVTVHAVEAWQDRYRPDATFYEALQELIALSLDALEIPGGVRSDGKTTWMHPTCPTARFVVGPPLAGESREALVTVLDAVQVSSLRVRSTTKTLTRHQRARWHAKTPRRKANA